MHTYARVLVLMTSYILLTENLEQYCIVFENENWGYLQSNEFMIIS